MTTEIMDNCCNHDMNNDNDNVNKYCLMIMNNNNCYVDYKYNTV